MREFETGATRDSDDGKFDYEGFLSPLVIERFAEFMHHHRRQADGQLRDSDNWQKGIPIPAYMKSLWRHFFAVWKLYRGHRHQDEKGKVVDLETELCAVIFNAQGMLHELLKAKPEVPDDPDEWQYTTEPAYITRCCGDPGDCGVGCA